MLKKIKKALLFAVLVAFAACSKENNPDPTLHFPDSAFRAELVKLGFVETNGDIDPENKTNKALLETIDALEFISKPIASLQGIEYFKELEYLKCTGGMLTSLVMPENPDLEYLDCQDNKLTVLDVTKCINLKTLYCSNNELKELDVQKCRILKEIEVYNNALTSLDLEDEYGLLAIICYGNRLDKLDIAETPNLQVVKCGEQLDNKQLTLKITPLQQAMWDSQKNDPYNNRVTAQIVP